MIQNILIVLIFIFAVGYLARMMFRQLSAKSACTTGCGKCSAVDFNKIEAAIAASEKSKATKG